MTETPNEKPCDLEERTFGFAGDVRLLVKRLPNHAANQEDGRQV